MKITKMNAYQKCQEKLLAEPKAWLITGVAGFIGSNLLESLLLLNQKVIGLDNFSTGYQRNLDEVRILVSPEQWSRFNFFEGDIRNLDDCKRVCDGVDYVLHEAALGSVPRSLEDPIATNQNNIDGFLNMLIAARDAKVKSFTYAASSSTYGDHPGLPKVEGQIGKPLSPYAVTKYVNELYSDVFARCYDFKSIGLRYFNVFGRRQDPNGAYAAVIPKWVDAMIAGKQIHINGDGETSRDFCYVDNVVQANLLAATTLEYSTRGEVYNVAIGERINLNQLFLKLKSEIVSLVPTLSIGNPIYQDFRSGDVRHSEASIAKIGEYLGYSPSHKVSEGIKEAIEWYVSGLSDVKR